VIRQGAAVLVAVLAAALPAGPPAGAAARQPVTGHRSGPVLTGRVLVAGRPVAGSRVTLYRSTRRGPERLGRATTGPEGRFAIAHRPLRAGLVVYAVADGGTTPAGARLQLLAVADPRHAPTRLTVNELTTVASAYALSRFLHGERLTGGAIGMRNAAATAQAFVDARSGMVADEIAEAPNGRRTASLAILNTLADVVAGCTAGTPPACARLLAAAAPPGGPRPATTLGAVRAIALDPVHHVDRIFGLHTSHHYGPRLTTAPTAWVLTLLHTDGGFDGPGRMAIDSRGDLWVTNNFEPPGTEAGTYVISLDPTGHPRPANPVSGGGVLGNWWGIAIDDQDRVWLGNYTGDDPVDYDDPAFVGGDAVSQFTSGGTPLSPPDGFQQGDLQAPQGIAVDQSGNVWIANHEGSSVTEYVDGDPQQAQVYTGGGLFESFAVEVDGEGNVWIDNGAIDEDVAGSLTEITANGDVLGPFYGDLSSPQGMAFDSTGHLWVTSFGTQSVSEFSGTGDLVATYRASGIRGPWGIAVDGDDNVWVTSFVGSKLVLLCGRQVDHCPPGSKTGDRISPRRTGFDNGGLQHLTAVQIDESGNVWVANNWKRIKPVVGGDGLVEYVGAAAPVRTPLIGLPHRP
jgi:sugar lactone lactonase YvrE